MIEVRNLSVSFGDKVVFAEKDFQIPKGKLTLLVGASGCGKTTLLRVLAGLQKAEGAVVGAKPEDMAVSFQEARLFPWRTVRDQLMLVGATREDADRLLLAAGLAKEADAFPGELSGGMRGRVSVLRALAADRAVVLLDEPLAGLDEATAANIVALILAETVGKTVVVITHHPEMFAQFEPHIIEL